MRNWLIFLFALLLSATTRAQSDTNRPDWKHYDSMLLKKMLLENTRQSIDSVRRICLSQERYAEAARSWQYLIAIDDARTEDTLFFFNSYPIDSILQRTNNPVELQFCFLLMQAQRLRQFSGMSKKFDYSKYRSPGGSVPFAQLNSVAADSLIALYFEDAIELAGKIPAKEYRQLLWLSNDATLFLFEPTAFDIAMGNYIPWKAARSGWEFSESVRQNTEWRNWNSDQMTRQILSGDSSWLTANETIQLYGRWMRYWIQNKSTQRYLESLLRKWLNHKIDATTGSHEWLNYNRYLQAHISEPFAEARMHAALQLVQRFTERADEYLPVEARRESSWYYGYGSKGQQYDTLARLYADSALLMWENLSATADSFQLIRQMVETILIRYRLPSIRFRMPEVQLPEEPLLVEAIYRHATNIQLLVYRVGLHQQPTNGKLESQQLPAGEPFWTKKLALPDAGDMNEHLVHLKIDGLPAGRYSLYVVYDSLLAEGKWSASSEFQVSALQVLQENNKVFVLNRKTGQAIAGARVKLFAPNSKRLISSGRTNQNGLVEMKTEKTGRLQVSFGIDSIQENFDPEAPRLPDEIFSRSEYENRLEFYDDNTVVHVYLDRGIYRPGDTVFYKAILLTRDPNTGEWMIANKRNLSKGRVFSLYQKMMREAEPWLFVQDPFGNERDSLQIKLNEFGSLAGRFVIPLTAPTGDWEIESDYFDQEGGSFRVEEYKRPSYELTINKPIVPLLPGDSFSFEVKLRSFSGAPMSGVNIGYRITRTDNATNEWKKLQQGITDKTVIQESSAQSSIDGSLTIPVVDSIWKTYLGEDRNGLWLRYNINVKVTDATGETYEESSVCTVSAQPITISMVSDNEMILGHRSVLQFRLNHINAGAVQKAIRLRIRKDADDTEAGYGYRAIAADQFIYPLDSLKHWFGELVLTKEMNVVDSTVLIDTLLSETSPMLQLAQTGLLPGAYRMELTVSEADRLLGKTTKTFSLFSTELSRIPVSGGVVNLEVGSSVGAGEKLPVYSGSNNQSWSRLWHYRYFDSKGRLHEKYEWMQGRPGLQKWILPVPVDASGSLYLTGISVINNRVYEYSKRIQIFGPVENGPEIVIERYRQSLTPGSKERFEVSVRESDAPVLAELMSTLYDASLDKLEKLRWDLPRTSRELWADANWQTGANSYRRSVGYLHGGISNHTIISQGELYVHGSEVSKSLFWYNPLDYYYADDMPAPFRGNYARLHDGVYDVDGIGIKYGFLSRIPGIAISSASGLDEVVVTGYGAAKRLNSVGASSSVILLGMGDLSAYNQPLIVLDGFVFTGDLSTIDPATIVSGLVLKGAEGSAIFGARAAQGVLVLSTKGEIQLPKPAEIPVVSRKNFAASAFFFPQLRANKEGRFTMSFTMPESVTEWKWKLLAHTRGARFAYMERTLRSSLPLMVQPAMPRFVYAGDSIVLSCRISNLDSVAQSGVAMLQVLDSANNTIAELSQKATIDLSAGSSTVVEFPFKVKPQQLDHLSIRMLARTEHFADGEEHLLPVLQKELWVQYPQDFQLNANDTSFTRPASISSGKWMGTAVSVKKEKAAELFDGLSYLSAFELDCAEQLVNKIFADLQAWRLLQRDKTIQQAFAKLEVSVAGLRSKDAQDELPGQKAMPWLSLMESEAEQAYRKWNLLDSSRIQTRVEQNFAKLFKLQNDAGLAWFPGGESDAFISTYVLRKLGTLQMDPNWKREIQPLSYQFQTFKVRLLRYVDTLLLKAFTKEQEQLWLTFAHARSYWLTEQPLDANSREWVLENLSRMASSYESMELAAMAKLAVTYQRFDPSEKAHTQIHLIWNNLVQRSIRDGAGMRWREISNSPTASAHSEEQLLLMAEAMKLFSTDSSMLTDVARWLMDTRQQRNWRSTRSQSAFIELIQMARMPLWNPTAELLWSIDETKHRISSNPLGNLGQKFSRSVSARDQVQLMKDGEGRVAGRVIWHYLTDRPEHGAQAEKLRLTQNWLRWNDSTSNWQPIAQGERLSLGQKIACEVIIDALEPLSYVQLESYHPACASPLEMVSEYRYGKNWRYYQSVRDERVDLFAGKLPEGRSSVLFEFRVEKKGVFQFRPAVVRAMYEMGVEAYGRAGEIIVQ